MPQTFTPWKAISTPLHKSKKSKRNYTVAVHHYAAFGLAARWLHYLDRRSSEDDRLRSSPFQDLLPLQSFTKISHSTSLPVISVQTEPSSFCSLVLLYLCHFATFAQRVELSSSWGSGLWMYPNTVPMRLGPHADELASQDTSFVQFEAQKKALEISAALRDLRQVDIRS